MGHERADREVLTVIGLAIHTSNENAHEIGAVWQRFMSESLGDQIPARTDATTVAAYYEYEGDHTAPFTFLLGCPVAPGTQAPEGFARIELPAGDYARFTAEGAQPQALMQTWMEIWNADLTRAFELDYEVHDPAQADRVEIYVGTREV